jgi:hypothetical protein
MLHFLTQQVKCGLAPIQESMETTSSICIIGLWVLDKWVYFHLLSGVVQIYGRWTLCTRMRTMMCLTGHVDLGINQITTKMPIRSQPHIPMMPLPLFVSRLYAGEGTNPMDKWNLSC